ncbi:hypothetical protein A2572_01920 [Candidatus Collierbacteria bacterium RIFOXYD1_FULL_40_9]|uniref:Nicotinamide mononucleotide transporter PnuC n=1 Tax=Candidatus Collierbacteria bacterium RIFOXYD1_FULL_40_9 TaxID=1817731 RepID=A0A1F5FUF0_9BACT|nr:MAG: hypothetical protein A2572_01920 [Candidatus Collierbacteria bacterium RIFOXYD1_FULL_40_9]
MDITKLFNVNTLIFTLWGYPMSYLEFFGTIFTAWSVYLAAKNKISTWPTSIIGIILYGFLFYQIQLYSDLFEQIYYFITAFWGWYLWKHSKRVVGKERPVTSSKTPQNLLGLGATVLLSFLLYLFMSRIHLILPSIFPTPASFPFLDAFTTALSFVATIYLAKRKIENWYYWIVVDIIGVWLYFQKDVYFLSLLYFVFLINALYGYKKWLSEVDEQQNV